VEGQKAIASYTVSGEQLFHPAKSE